MKTSQMIFGLHAVEAALRQRPREVQSLVVLAGRHDPRMQALLALAKQHKVAVEQQDRTALDRLCQGTHQGIIAWCQSQVVLDESVLAAWPMSAEKPPLILALDSVTDPHNLGACLRSADGAGVTAVIAPKDRSASITPAVQKVACGAAETVPFIAVTNLARTLKSLKEQGFWVVGLAGEADQTLFEMELTGPLVVVLGAEGDGLRRLTKEHCDFLAKIPMQGAVESLNVSVATGITLFECVRQRLASR